MMGLRHDLVFHGDASGAHKGIVGGNKMKLAGAHKKLDCIACHKSELIGDAELKKKKKTYLGLKTECIACHKDAHQGTLSTTDCASCHNMEAFKPAALLSRCVGN